MSDAASTTTGPSRNDAAAGLASFAERHWQRNQAAVVIVLLINVLALGYALTQDIYTNHTFPNSLVLPRPSFRTSEGRWGTDLIYYLLGGSGVPQLSLMLAILAQVANGLLFAGLLGLSGTYRIALCAALVSVHPFMLDYYGYSGDDLSFALGDTLILAGVALPKRSRWHVIASVAAISTALSLYQPKVSLLLTLIVLMFIADVIRWRSTGPTLWHACLEGLASAACALVGAVLYLGELSVSRWLIPSSGGAYFDVRTHAADLSAMLRSVRLLSVDLGERLFADSSLFPRPISWLLAALLLGFALLVIRRFRESVPIRQLWPALMLLTVAVLLLPLCLYAALIVSALETGAGRFYVPFAYLLAFLLLMCGEMLRHAWSRRIWLVLGALVVAVFVVRDTQILHRAHLARIQEMGLVTRLANRLESTPGFGSAVSHPLVVIGEPPHSWPDLDLGAGSIRSNFENRGFIEFRQVEALNFLVGHRQFRYPTLAEIDLAIDYASGHSPWPAPDSVAILDSGVAVAVFQRPGTNIPITSAFGEDASADR